MIILQQKLDQTSTKMEILHNLLDNIYFRCAGTPFEYDQQQFRRFNQPQHDV